MFQAVCWAENDGEPYCQKCGCTAVAWAALRIKIVSPVILIHGNESEGAFFDRQGFKYGLETLSYWVTDNSIDMDTSLIVTNAMAPVYPETPRQVVRAA